MDPTLDPVSALFGPQPLSVRPAALGTGQPSIAGLLPRRVKTTAASMPASQMEGDAAPVPAALAAPAPLPAAAPRPSIAPAGGNSFGNGVSDFASGAAGVNPTSPPISAFAQGLAGSLNAQRGRQDADAKSQRADEAQAYQRGQDTFKNSMDMKREAREQARSDAEIAKAQAETPDNVVGPDGLTDKDQVQIEKMANSFARQVGLNDFTPDAGRPAMLDQVQVYRTQLVKEFKARNKQTGGGAPAQEETPAKSDTAAPAEKKPFFKYGLGDLGKAIDNSIFSSPAADQTTAGRTPPAKVPAEKPPALLPAPPNVLTDAKAAIDAGADPKLVKQRMIDSGMDPSGL